MTKPICKGGEFETKSGKRYFVLESGVNYILAQNIDTRERGHINTFKFSKKVREGSFRIVRSGRRDDA